MGIFNSSLCGNIRKSVGKSTMYMLNGQNIIRRKISYRSKTTEKQLEQQLKFKALSKLGHFFESGRNISFSNMNGNDFICNFIKYNQKNVEVDIETKETTIFEDKLLITSGKLLPPEVKGKYVAESHSVELESQWQRISPLAKPNDDIFAVLYDFDDEIEIKFAYVGKRGAESKVLIELNEYFKIGTTVVQVFAVSESQKNLSDSVCCKIEVD